MTAFAIEMTWTERTRVNTFDMLLEPSRLVRLLHACALTTK